MILKVKPAFLAALAGTLACVYWLSLSSQPLIDLHEFRQTQTAISTRYLDVSIYGLLHYQTPVLGYPWSIPFEFPLYQLFVYISSKFLGFSQPQAGRLMSSCFAVLSLLASCSLLFLHKIKSKYIYLFSILFLVSPVYLYWGRSFTIETCALFFSLLSYCFYSFIRMRLRCKSSTLSKGVVFCSTALAVCLVIAVLVKSTTALPVVLLIAFVLLYDIIKVILNFARHNPFSRVRFNLSSACLTFPSLILSISSLHAWTRYSDSLKLLNPLGSLLTSSRLSVWTFGDLRLRLSNRLLFDVILIRHFSLLGALVCVLIAFAFIRLRSQNNNLKGFMNSLLFLWLSPLLITTSLHITHLYYQVANHVYLLLLISVAAVSMETVENRRYKRVLKSSILLFASFGLLFFAMVYLPQSLTSSSEKMVLGSFIDKETSLESAIIVIDPVEGWSSAIPYHSNRKAIAYSYMDELRALGYSYDTGGLPVSAVVTRDVNTLTELRSVCKPHRIKSFKAQPSIARELDDRLRSLLGKSSKNVDAEWTVALCKLKLV